MRWTGGRDDRQFPPNDTKATLSWWRGDFVESRSVRVGHHRERNDEALNFASSVLLAYPDC